jgi:hypothetical protein
MVGFYDGDMTDEDVLAIRANYISGHPQFGASPWLASAVFITPQF